jgi:hypothetical protein
LSFGKRKQRVSICKCRKCHKFCKCLRITDTK